MTYVVEAVGWTGAVMLLLAYGLLSAGRVGGQSPAYQVMNILGAVGLIVNSGWNGAYPSAAVNVIWLAIGLAALSRRS
jgi:hypothetical protein